MRRATLAAAVACALMACRAVPAAGTQQTDRSGGAMSETSVTWLDGGGPWLSGSEESSELVDPKPLVLWSGDRPAAVLAYHGKSQLFGLRQTRSFRRVDRGPSGPFPVETSRTVSLKERNGEEGYDTGSILRADVDGDGTDELILPRWGGGVDVLGVKKELPGFRGVGAKTSVATYRVRTAQVARLPGGAVVHVLFERVVEAGEPTEADLKHAGAADPYVLVRVDRGGAKRVVLGELGYRVQGVLAVGVLNRPGSTEMDELLVLSRDAGADVYLSRHRPDGTPLETARKVYVPIAGAGLWSFAFLPQSRKAIVHAPDVSALYFVEPEKPVNWVRRVDLEKATKPYGHPQLLGVLDPQASPKAVLQVSGDLWAVDEDGQFHGWSGGTLVPVKEPADLCLVPEPGPKHSLVELVPSPTRADELLLVYTRKRQPRDLTREEIHEAADRYLTPEEVAKERRQAVPTLDDRDAVRDGKVARERKRRGVDAEIKTIEEWKRLLPDSYAETVADRG